MEKMNDLRDLLKHEIADLHSAEEQIINAMPSMIENASDPNLKQSLERHLRITEQQLKRIEQIHTKLEGKKQEKQGLWSRLTQHSHECKGMKGIIDEGEKLMREDMDPDVKDAAIIASCQKIEHYEICGYGTAKAYAEELNLSDIVEALSKTLNEEYEADLLLSDLAENRVNKEAEGKSTSRGSRTTTSRERVRSEEYEMEMATNSRSNKGNARGESDQSRGSRSSAADKKTSSKGRGASTSSSKGSASRNPRGNTRNSSNGRNR
ncbi:MAG TPA: ferritin-like domain-containing protein [Chitinophagaceae bacterium]